MGRSRGKYGYPPGPIMFVVLADPDRNWVCVIDDLNRFGGMFAYLRLFFIFFYRALWLSFGACWWYGGLSGLQVSVADSHAWKWVQGIPLLGSGIGWWGTASSSTFDARQGETANISQCVGGNLQGPIARTVCCINTVPARCGGGHDVAACCTPTPLVFNSFPLLVNYPPLSLSLSCRGCTPDGRILQRTWSPCPCAMDPNCHLSTLGMARRTSNSSSISVRGCMRTSSRSASWDASTR